MFESLKVKILIGFISLICIMMSSTVMSYYSRMSEHNKEESKFGNSFAVLILILSIAAISLMIFLHFKSQRY